MTDIETTISTQTDCSNISCTDIVINKKIILDETIECPICFENINSDDPILILDCCRKKIHLPCILKWYATHPNNKVCFMCNQGNNFCKDLVYYEEVSDEETTEHVYPINITINNLSPNRNRTRRQDIIIPTRRDNTANNIETTRQRDEEYQLTVRQNMNMCHKYLFACMVILIGFMFIGFSISLSL